MDANKLISKLRDCMLDDKRFYNNDVVVHLGGVVLPIESVSTDAEGKVYLDCSRDEYIKQENGKLENVGTTVQVEDDVK